MAFGARGATATENCQAARGQLKAAGSELQTPGQYQVAQWYWRSIVQLQLQLQSDQDALVRRSDRRLLLTLRPGLEFLLDHLAQVAQGLPVFGAELARQVVHDA